MKQTQAGTPTESGRKPELLCPAGSPLALDAAIEGGADAVYLGGIGFNARMNATNFTEDALKDGIRRAHAFGVKIYLTLNTLLLDRERTDYLRAAEFARNAGADALIVADLGGADAIHRHFPDLALHASTQMSAHGADAGDVLQSLGFSRMVVARELSLPDLREAVRRSPIEIEAFIHGALCVCHSGQCLFSSMVGGRSGNRGECAQPCRLPYRLRDGKEGYPLSLKDLSLAAFIPEIIDAGIASLKIEGRMKSPEYVLTVTRIFRTLLDEGRAANPDEGRQLAEAFSRGGFTDGYFTSHIDHRMLGVRSEDDKKAGAALSPFRALTRRVPIDMTVTLRQDQPATLAVTNGKNCFVAEGDVPQPAINAPLDRETVVRQLARLGNTPYTLRQCAVTLDGGLMLPVSALNALRRAAVDGLSAALSARSDEPLPVSIIPPTRPMRERARPVLSTAQFSDVGQLTPMAAEYFDRCYLPLEALPALTDEALARLREQTEICPALPPVIMDHEREIIRARLQTAKERGFSRVLVGNLGHLSLVREAGMIPDGDFRLNVTNTESVAVLERLGVDCPILSPELTLPQIRDVRGDVRTVVYGRIPLMVLEKCAIREIADCDVCARGDATLTDRRGARFPIRRVWQHRNVIYNSLPTYMADEQDRLVKNNVGGWHFLFTAETPEEVDSVIRAFGEAKPAAAPVRRLGR